MESLLSGGLGVWVVIFLFVLGVLWLLLPFAIFGTKDKLDELIAESKKTNELLIGMRGEVTEVKSKDTQNN
tara:strand:- start:194 stop:406 length:213 start_codon:yes stop_codon:yes gene_type:complete